MANQSSPLPPNSPLVTRTPPVPTGQQRNTNTAQDGSLSPVMVRSKSPISAPNSPIEQRAMFGNHSVPIINGHTHFRQSQRGPQQFTHPVGGPIYGPTLVQPSVPAYALHSPLVGVDPAAAVGAYNVPQQRASQDFPPSQISDDIELAEMKRLVSQRDHDEAIASLELQVQLKKKITAAALRLLKESSTRRGVRLRERIYLQAVTKLNSLEGQLRDLKIGRCVIIREDGGRKKKARPMSDDEEGFLRQAQLMANQSSPLPPNSPLVTRTPPVPTGQQRNTNTAQDGSLSPVMVRSKSPISAPNSPIEQRAMFGNHSVPIINGHTHFRESQRGPQQFTHPVGGPIYGPTLVQPSVPAYALHSPLVGVDPAAAVGAYNVPQQRASQDFPPSQISDDIELAEMKRLVSQRDHYIRPIDGGYAWTILVCSFMCRFVVEGICHIFGFFMDDVIAEFSVRKGFVIWAGSLLAGVHVLVGPFAFALIDVIGCARTVIFGSILGFVSFIGASQAKNFYVFIFTYGVMGGIGLGLISSPAVFLPHLYFEKKLKSAIAISSCGPCFGILCFAPFATWLEETYGWRVAHLIISVIVLFCCVFGALMSPLPLCHKSKKQSDYEGKREQEVYSLASSSSASSTHQQSGNFFNNLWENVGCSVLKDKKMVLLAISSVLDVIGVNIVSVLIVDVAVSQGDDSTAADDLSTFITLANIFGTFLIGYLSDLASGHILLLTNICRAWSALFIFCFLFFKVHYEMRILTVLFGIFSGAFDALIQVVIINVFDTEKLTRYLGVNSISRGIALIVGPPFARMLYATTFSYEVLFTVAGVFLCFSIMCNCLIAVVQVAQK
ncbi:monocarboxylate transporter 12-like isoform X2 [Artemia franciscana]|uniref:monocarboxylate transporter 12-like isoform X2 n=1 Tax=Artemia franciscana TaxID=6661 RepID=UPI0032D9BFFD